ncbi:hypothetical protein ACWERY_05765 [Streptomyces sp. NPDC004082]|uniref:hypothetical protein n=1 Tax=Streptomyces sp. NPDC005481 TaxID=3154881 RepID=UPI0033AD361F
MDHVRIHLLWPVFQPDPSVVNPAALERLCELMDLADHPHVSLDVSISVLDGRLGGLTFLPAWLNGRNMVTDEDAVRAELTLFDAVAECVGDHRRFLGFDLGNELSTFNGDVPPESGDRWASLLLDHCERIAPGRFHVNGVDHQSWFQARTFSPRAAAAHGSASVLHAYPYRTGATERYGPDGTGVLHLGEYLAEFAEAFSPTPGRAKWLQSFGTSPVERPADTIPQWAASFTRNTLSSRGMWGCTWWSSHDIDRRFTGFTDCEYDVGLFTVVNDIKPVGIRLRDLIRELRHTPVRPVDRHVGLVLPDSRPIGLRAADRFFTLVDQGVRPALVTHDRADDTTHLSTRGITELVRC